MVLALGRGRGWGLKEHSRLARAVVEGLDLAGRRAPTFPDVAISSPPGEPLQRAARGTEAGSGSTRFGEGQLRMGTVSSYDLMQTGQAIGRPCSQAPRPT